MLIKGALVSFSRREYDIIIELSWISRPLSDLVHQECCSSYWRRPGNYNDGHIITNEKYLTYFEGIRIYPHLRVNKEKTFAFVFNWSVRFIHTAISVRLPNPGICFSFFVVDTGNIFFYRISVNDYQKRTLTWEWRIACRNRPFPQIPHCTIC